MDGVEMNRSRAVLSSFLIPIAVAFALAPPSVHAATMPPAGTTVALATAGLNGSGSFNHHAALAPLVTHDPTTSPAPYKSRYVSGPLTGPQGVADCSSGFVCAYVQAPGSNRYKEFYFYSYGTYYLSYWLNDGSIINDQTGNASARIIRQDGSYYTVKAIPNSVDPVNPWDSFWKITLLRP
jgi:hypothetical protein